MNPLTTQRKALKVGTATFAITEGPRKSEPSLRSKGVADCSEFSFTFLPFSLGGRDRGSESATGSLAFTVSSSLLIFSIDSSLISRFESAPLRIRSSVRNIRTRLFPPGSLAPRERDFPECARSICRAFAQRDPAAFIIQPPARSAFYFCCSSRIIRCNESRILATKSATSVAAAAPAQGPHANAPRYYTEMPRQHRSCTREILPTRIARVRRTNEEKRRGREKEKKRK